MVSSYVSHKLRSYIFPSAPATRAPCDGTEPDMRVEFGFTPKWFHEYCGIDFGEKWHRDPAYRQASVVAMRKELEKRFPSLGLGHPEVLPASLDGINGALTVAMLFGIKPQFFPDNWPVAQHNYLDEDSLKNLHVPDIENSVVFDDIVRQWEWIRSECGRVEGYLNWQGVLNNAHRLCGEGIFLYLMTDPQLAHYVFHVVAETMIAGMKHLYSLQAETGFYVRHATLSNCLVNMLSPDQYREHVMPYDKMISDSFEYFGIHNCAWNVDPYIQDYARIRVLGYVDMGLDSNLRRVKELCPDTRRAVMYNPKDLANKSPDDIRKDLFRIRRELSPCDIVMADIDVDTPDDRVHFFARVAEEACRFAEAET